MTYITHYLRFADEQEAHETLLEAFGEPQFGDDYGIDYVGDISGVSGYHVNVACEYDLPVILEPFRIPTPQHPIRVFA